MKTGSFGELRELSLLRRGMVDTYPPFLKVTCLSSVDSGESGDSGHDLGFDGRGKIGVISGIPERFAGEISEPSQNRYQG